MDDQPHITKLSVPTNAGIVHLRPLPEQSKNGILNNVMQGLRLALHDPDAPEYPDRILSEEKKENIRTLLDRHINRLYAGFLTPPNIALEQDCMETMAREIWQEISSDDIQITATQDRQLADFLATHVIEPINQLAAKVSPNSNDAGRY